MTSGSRAMPGLVGGPFPVPPRLRRHGKAAHTPTDHPRGRLCPQVGRVKTNKENINTHKKTKAHNKEKPNGQIGVKFKPALLFSFSSFEIERATTTKVSSKFSSYIDIKRKDKL